MAACEVRRVVAADVPSVVALVRGTLAEFGIAFGEGSETDAALYDLPRSYEAPGGVFLVASLGGELVGTAGLFPMGAEVFELRKMYLSPSARGAGVGHALLSECLTFARARGGRRITLDTTEQMTAAIAFYERHGFVRDDTYRRASRCTRGYRLDL